MLDPHHRVPRAFKKNGRRSPNWDPDAGNNVVPICRTCHDTFHSSIYIGQVIWEGADSHKQRALAVKITKLLKINERFIHALPRFAVAYWRKWEA